MLNLIEPDPTAPTLVVGLGCQRGCSAQALLELIEQSLQRAGVRLQAISALASIDLKADEPGLLQVASQLNLQIRFFSAAHMTRYETQLSHRSPVAFAHTGCYGIAESAALALAGQSGDATLLISRQKSLHATFALAICPAPDR